MTNIGIQYLNVQEQIRHNMATERLSSEELGIKAGELRVHQGTLDESIRHNLVSEAQADFQNRTQRINAETNRMNAETNAGRLALDSYMYYDTGRAINQAKIQESQAKVRESNTKADLNLANIRSLSYQNNLNIVRAAEASASGRLMDTKIMTEQRSSVGSVTGGLGRLISGIGSLLKFAH